MEKFLWGFVGIGISYLMVRYRKQVVDWTGKFAWAEHYLGRGGTYNAIVLFSILIFMFSILYMSGSLDFFFEGLKKFFIGEGE